MTLTTINKAETYEYLSNMFLTILLGSLAFLTVSVFVHGFGIVGWIPEYITVLNLVQAVLLGSLFILPSYLLGGFFDTKARKLKEVHNQSDGPHADPSSAGQKPPTPVSDMEGESKGPSDIFGRREK